MKRNKYTILGAIFLSAFLGMAQPDSTLVEINDQIWTPFSTAFKTLDFKLFESIHHDDLIRVSGNGDRIVARETYLNQYKVNWKNSDRELSIDFRFTERIYSEDRASERGIYKMGITSDSGQTDNYYGKFHVILVKEDGTWRILVDYDSNEDNTITEESYKVLNPSR